MSNPFNTSEAPDFLADITEFHEKFGLEQNHGPVEPDLGLMRFRAVTHLEEAEEFRYALDKYVDGGRLTDLEKMLDACVDQLYFVIGTCYVNGWDLGEAWRRVHAANMAKVRAEKESDSKRGSRFDVVKPPGWVPPDLSDLVMPVEPE